MNELDGKPLNDFARLFSSLTAPQPAELTGAFNARLVGPGWLRKVGLPALALGGLGGWQGKEFLFGEQGANLVRRRGSLMRVLPFLVDYQPSRLDGKPAAVILYQTAQLSPALFFWGWVVDELRWLDERNLLGMTMLKAGVRQALPFLLSRDG